MRYIIKSRCPIRLIIVLLFIATINTFGQSRSIDDAMKIAENYLNNSKIQLKNAQISDVLNLSYISKDDNQAYYYVFNFDDDNGFIVISGDDRAKDILGYSDNGGFDINNIPENMKYWLSFYQEELEMLYKQENTIHATKASYSNNDFKSAVRPLLKTKWNQGDPYNLQCPKIPTGENAATGCVATAAAQIMKYHKYPERGTGSNSYRTKTHEFDISVDFSNSYYDWSNMTNTYSRQSSQVQKDAVATLMFHCGVAVNMDYDSESGAVSRHMARALIDNFGYDSNLQIYLRDYYSALEWNNMIKAELNASRPVYYSGSSEDAGHAFVCDGYNNDGFFHFNWGWGGYSDGYFQLSALDVGDDVGIGGGSGGFNQNQEIITGIQKPTSLSQPSHNIYFENIDVLPMELGRNETFTANFHNTFNYGVNAFSGYIGLTLYQNGEFKTTITAGSLEGNPLPPSYGWEIFDFSDVKIPSNFASGNYQLRLTSSTDKGRNWAIIRGNIDLVSYLNVSITSSKIVFSLPSDGDLQHEDMDSDLVLYIVPKSEELNIVSAEEIRSISIFELSGKEILSMTINSKGTISIPIEKLHKGVYIIRIKGENKIISRRFLKY